LIVFDRVSKQFPQKKGGIWDLSLQIQEGETLALLGMSGSGKSTTLKMVNRLIDPDEGTIYVQGKDILKQDLIELRRQIGFAVQEIGLFPHMTVAENIGIGPQLLGWSKTRIEERVEYLIQIFGMDPTQVKNRYPSELSGGQQQRVGVARALAADPPILLMDEPFGALDPITREQVQKEFRDLETKIKKTVIFVTHDLFEAVAVGDRIGLMDQGRLLQLSTPREFIENPPTDFGDQFMGKHRFQLSLLTKPIINYLHPPTSDEKKHREALSTKSSFFDALTLFRQSNQTKIPVFSGGNLKGELKKETFLDEILTLLMES
jgi:osmoprotectant transport system ATP-binding protein